MNKEIRDFLPHSKPREVSLVQGRVDSSLVKDIRKIMKKHGLKWSEIITACLKKMKEEMK